MWETPTWPPSIQMGVTTGIFLASILLKEMRYLVYIRYLWQGHRNSGYVVSWIVVGASYPCLSLQNVVLHKVSRLKNFMLLPTIYCLKCRAHIRQFSPAAKVKRIMHVNDLVLGVSHIVL